MAVAPSISMTSTIAPAGIACVSSRARADHSSPESFTSPLRAVTSWTTTAVLPTSASLPSRTSGGRDACRRANGRTTTKPIPPAAPNATNWKSNETPRPAMTAATTAAAASSANTRGRVKYSATPRAAATSSHANHAIRHTARHWTVIPKVPRLVTACPGHLVGRDSSVPVAERLRDVWVALDLLLRVEVGRDHQIGSLPVSSTTPSQMAAVSTFGLTWPQAQDGWEDRKSTRLNSSHVAISYAVFCLKKK